MFLQTLCICLLVNALLVESTDIVIADVIRPKALSNEAHDWTDERLKAAIPLNMTLPSFSSRTGSSNANVSISSTGRQVYTTGRVF
jgi:hypothetical protein